jgi:SAM-dependent methyltransferase
MTQAADGYKDDLAYTHDAGFLWFANGAAPGLLALLRRNAVGDGLVVDLGCGSGAWAHVLTEAGYNVLGIDYSAAMIALAKKRAPKATVRRGSYLDVRLPHCDAVTSIGECLNYLFDRDAKADLTPLFRRVHDALRPGGVFIFDVVGPGQVRGGTAVQRHRLGDDWAVFVKVEEDAERRVLTRRITTFRRIGKLYRRGEEVHRLRLYEGRELADRLERVGFGVRTLRRFGDFSLGKAHVALVARKR